MNTHQESNHDVKNIIIEQLKIYQILLKNM